MLLKLMLVLVGAGTLLALIGAIARAIWRVPDAHDETHYVQASDGWRLAIHRVRPKEPDPQRFPVILCHGLGANRFNFHFPGRYSLASYLAERGWDVYVPELRGAGWSMKRAWRERGRWDFGFSDFVEKDLPAIIGYVRGLTGKDRVHYVGHSMGGMILYGFARTPQAAWLASACAIGSPATFDHLRVQRKLARFRALLRLVPVLHIERGFAIFLPLASRWLPEFIKDNYNPANMSIANIRLAGANLVSPISTKLLEDFVAFLRALEFVTADGVDYSADLDKVTVPFFFIAGSVDKLGPPESLRFVHDRIASTDKVFRIFGKASGDSADYGHGDLVLSDAAIREVWPAIENWLLAHN